jgi:hypothetical protein
MSVSRVVIVLLLAGPVVLRGMQASPVEKEGGDEAAAVAALVGGYVERYYARAQHLLAEERVTLQPLTSSMGFAGLPRRLVYELRLEWNPLADEAEDRAQIVRELISSGGPPLGPPDQPDCLDPKAISPEPLGFLLPERQEAYAFRMAGPADVRGRPAVRLDYRPLEVQPAQVHWDRACGQVELPGRMRGRIWADATTGEILRMDEYLHGIVDLPGPDENRRPDPRRWFTIERVDTTIRYEPIRFVEPDETLMLPVRIENMTIIRNSGMPRLRTTRTFENYRRFLTESRLVASAGVPDASGVPAHRRFETSRPHGARAQPAP